MEFGPLSLARVVDECRSVLDEAVRRGEIPEFLRVNPAVVDAVAHERQREIARGVPVQLFGITLRKDESLDLYDARLQSLHRLPAR